ncbi:MAG: class I SAM-dependent methyltransferase [Planctomycetes bacterium]|nr:class I SAM-dependent methyltransferase [Planctomycetota bacterium]
MPAPAVETSPKKSAPKKAGRSLAAQADRYALYQRAVQQPDADLDFVSRVFRRRYGRPPRDVREDFCAAAFTACHWVRRNRENRAWGVDLDPEPLAWGRAHNVSELNDDQRGRLTLVQADVLAPRVVPPADIVLAQNFSYFIFKTRERLRAYFEAARAGLRPEGLLVLDLFGGPDSQRMGEERTRHRGFTYVWDQARYDAITNEILCHIHFEFPDRSRMRKAFSYDWRLWTIREVRELLAEAGFSASEAYWEGATAEGEGNGIYTRRESAVNEDSWLAYVVGIA